MLYKFSLMCISITILFIFGPRMKKKQIISPSYVRKLCRSSHLRVVNRFPYTTRSKAEALATSFPAPVPAQLYSCFAPSENSQPSFESRSAYYWWQNYAVFARTRRV